MKFRYLLEKGEQRIGVIEARSFEEAVAILEREERKVKEITQLEDPATKKYLLVFGLLCMLGLISMAVWGNRISTPSTKGSVSSEERSLQVEGTVPMKSLVENATVELTFPELPTKLARSWSDVGDPTGHFNISDELLYEGAPPSFYQLRMLDSQGNVLYEKRDIPYTSRTDHGK